MKNIWIKRCDFFNIPTSLSYKNEYFYSTIVGATLTMVLLLMLLGIIGYEIILLFSKTSFTLISNQYTDLSQVIDFSQTPFLFELTNHRGQIFDLYDNKLFSVEAYNTEMKIEIEEDGTRTRKITNNKLELEKCDKILLNKPEYSEIELNRFICLKPGQNLTSYGVIGDINNPFKGIRIYINKCSGTDCYDTDEIVKQLNNAKFIVSYLSLSSNIFYLNSENINYQLLSNYFSLSTNFLKKMVFSFDIGRFYIHNSIAFKSEILVDYIIGKDYSIDIELDPKSTIQNNEYTIATISFNYGGKIMETKKEVQTIFDSISIIGNFFNIILTLFKVINGYYSNKILFVDIFKTLFFNKEDKNFSYKLRFNRGISLNQNSSLVLKKNLDSSEQMEFNNNLKRKNSIKSINKKIITTTGKSPAPKKNGKITHQKKKNSKKNNFIYFYLLPTWILRKYKTFNSIYIIKERICKYFSIEEINELIKFKKNFEEKSMKHKISNTELITINNKYFEKNYLNGENNIIKIIK